MCIHTFCSHIFRPLQVVHTLQGFCLFPGKCLFIIEFTRSSYPVQYDPATGRVFEEEEDGKDKYSNTRRAKGGQQTNKNASSCRAAIADIDNY